MPKTHLVIWLNIPSFHQTDVLKALAKKEALNLEVIFARDIPLDRIQQGWIADYEGYSYRFLKSTYPYIDAVRLAWHLRYSFHIFNGIWGDWRLIPAVILVRLLGGSYAIMAESIDTSERRRTLFTQAIKYMIGNFVCRSKKAYLLAISHFAFEYFSEFGITQERSYEYGYFRAKSKISVDARPKDNHLVFVGRLIETKKVDLLLEAIIPFMDYYLDVHLTIIGDGSMRSELEEIVSNSGYSTRIKFVGALSSERVLKEIAHSSLLILPSRYDGWGVVINEALSVGVPVIVSDACGSADIIDHGRNGYIFKSGDIYSLRAVLQSFFAQDVQDRILMRQAVFDTAPKISAVAVADYLVKCIQHMQNDIGKKPIPPWRQ